MQETLGFTFCSASSDEGVTSFVSHIWRICCSAATRCNESKTEDNQRRLRRLLVIRGFKTADELQAFMYLLQYPSEAASLALRRGFTGSSHWTLELSVAYWALVLLRSPAVPALHNDDSIKLHLLQREMDSVNELLPLRAVAMGEITWQQYIDGTPVPKRMITTIFKRLLNIVDLFGTTPAESHFESVYFNLKMRAKAVVVDEGANMSKGDFFCVWGNVLLPCLIGGDPDQPPLTIMTKGKGGAGSFQNLHAEDGKIPVLKFLQATGNPVFRDTR
jgi:hypothetical protein